MKQTKTIIMFSGKMQSGKNFSADILKTMLKVEHDIIVDETMFADKLKNMSKLVFKPLSLFLSKTIERILKENGQKPTAAELYELSLLKLEDKNFYEDKTELSRILLQTLGTDIMRTHVDDEYWVKATADYITQSKSSHILITDWRFENEYTGLRDYLKETDIHYNYVFKLINVQRSKTAETSSEVKTHSSESSLNHFSGFNLIIKNDYVENIKKQINEGNIING